MKSVKFNSKKQKNLSIKDKLPQKFIQLAILIFLVKLIIIFNIPGKDVGSEQSIHFVKGIWLGADGENYLTGFKSLLADGILSQAYILHYWPAGYPLLIYFLSFLSKDLVLILLAIIQSLIFSIAVYEFAKALFKTKLKNYTFLIYLFILINPTLSLSSLSIGYESFVASAIMFSLVLIFKDFTLGNKMQFRTSFIISSLLYGFIGFMQPRYLLTGVLIHLFWFILRRKVKFASLTLVFGILLSFLLPSTLVARNYISTNTLSISTNLGETMAVGAGPGASGAYKKRMLDIPCELVGSASQRDQQLTKCVVDWYLKNPSAALVLLVKKAVYFWSPWTGPLAFGTMARNPWVGISPAIKVAGASNEGFKFVTGVSGKVISWIWLGLGLFLFFYGFVTLYRFNFSERNIAVLGLLVVLSQVLITMVTIGDHRFRVPTMPISLMFQAAALKSIFSFNHKSF